MISYPFVRRTLATLRMAEFGFLGVRVMTWMQTPRRNGEFSKAGDLDLYRTLLRPLRTSWLIVGICVKNRGKITVFCFGETERGIYQTHFPLQHLFQPILGKPNPWLVKIPPRARF